MDQTLLAKPTESRAPPEAIRYLGNLLERIDDWLDGQVIGAILRGRIRQLPQPQPPGPGPDSHGVISPGRDTLSILRRATDIRRRPTHWIQALVPQNRALRTALGFGGHITYQVMRAIRLGDWATIEKLAATDMMKDLTQGQAAFLLSRRALSARNLNQVSRLWHRMGGSRKLLRVQPEPMFDTRACVKGVKMLARYARSMRPRNSLDEVALQMPFGAILQRLWPERQLVAAGFRLDG